MKVVEETSHWDVLEYNGHIWRLSGHAHEKDYVWVSEDGEHSDFICDFRKKFVGHYRVENDFDSDLGASPGAFLNDAEASLAKLLAKRNLVKIYLSHS